jgi:GNAT superfamily N-acetyltransferase
MLTAGCEPFGDGFWVEAADLLHEEWQLVGPPGTRLTPRYGAYGGLANMGQLLLFTLRDERALAGYALFTLAADLHQNIPTMFLDALYVGKRWQGRRGGLKLVRAAEDVARARRLGRLVLTNSTQEFGESAARLYEILGYRPVTLSWLKEF